MHASNRLLGSNRLSGLHVLLAESETVIALDLEVTLRRLGCIICNIIISVTDTLKCPDQDRPDAVVLNPRLNDGSALSVAEVLRREQLLFVLVKDGLEDTIRDPV